MGTIRRRQGECEIVRGEGPRWDERICFRPATMRYPAMGGGFMHLCAEHGEQHARIVDKFGERWNAEREAWASRAAAPEERE